MVSPVAPRLLEPGLGEEKSYITTGLDKSKSKGRSFCRGQEKRREKREITNSPLPFPVQSEFDVDLSLVLTTLKM